MPFGEYVEELGMFRLESKRHFLPKWSCDGPYWHLPILSLLLLLAPRPLHFHEVSSDQQDTSRRGGGGFFLNYDICLLL